MTVRRADIAPTKTWPIREIQVFGEFRNVRKPPSFNLLSICSGKHLDDGSFVTGQLTMIGSELQYCINPPRKWRYKARIAQVLDLHVFTVYVLHNDVIVGVKDSPQFQVVPIWKADESMLKPGDDENEEEEDEDVSDNERSGARKSKAGDDNHYPSPSPNKRSKSSLDASEMTPPDPNRNLAQINASKSVGSMQHVPSLKTSVSSGEANTNSTLGAFPNLAQLQDGNSFSTSSNPLMKNFIAPNFIQGPLGVKLMTNSNPFGNGTAQNNVTIEMPNGHDFSSRRNINGFSKISGQITGFDGIPMHKNEPSFQAIPNFASTAFQAHVVPGQNFDGSHSDQNIHAPVPQPSHQSSFKPNPGSSQPTYFSHQQPTPTQQSPEINNQSQVQAFSMTASNNGANNVNPTLHEPSALMAQYLTATNGRGTFQSNHLQPSSSLAATGNGHSNGFSNLLVSSPSASNAGLPPWHQAFDGLKRSVESSPISQTPSLLGPQGLFSNLAYQPSISGISLKGINPSSTFGGIPASMTIPHVFSPRASNAPNMNGQTNSFPSFSPNTVNEGNGDLSTVFPTTNLAGNAVASMYQAAGTMTGGKNSKDKHQD